MARHGVSYLRETVYETRVYHIGDINRRESLGACGTSVYKRPRVNALHYGNVMARRNRAMRISSFTYAAALRTGDNGARREQWRERDTARYVRPPRISQSTLRTRRDSWVESRMQRCVVCFMRKWQIRIVEKQRIVPARRGAAVYSLYKGAVILSSSQSLRHRERAPCVE